MFTFVWMDCFINNIFVNTFPLTTLVCFCIFYDPCNITDFEKWNEGF